MQRSVLHLDTERTWRGGENQLRLLLEHAPAGTWAWHLAAPPGSELLRRCSPLAAVQAIPMQGAALLTAAIKLARYIRKHNISILDCQSSRAHNLGLLIKLMVPSCKLIVHRRVDYPPGRSWINRKKYLSPLVDSYICISEKIAAVLGHYGVDADRLQVVRSAVDGTAFQSLDRTSVSQHWRQQWNLPAATPVIGNVAYLTEQKDHATLLRALGQLHSEGCDFFCYIAGEGPLEASLKALAASLRLDERHLRFLGLRHDVDQLLATSDIFALSSQDEGLGTSLLDATHSGCALVATAAGGIPEIIQHQKTGLLAPVGDSQRLAQELRRLLEHPELRTEYVRAAQSLAAEKFSLAAMVQGNLAVYERLWQQAKATSV